MQSLKIMDEVNLFRNRPAFRFLRLVKRLRIHLRPANKCCIYTYIYI